MAPGPGTKKHSEKLDEKKRNEVKKKIKFMWIFDVVF